MLTNTRIFFVKQKFIYFSSLHTPLFFFQVSSIKELFLFLDCRQDLWITNLWNRFAWNTKDYAKQIDTKKTIWSIFMSTYSISKKFLGVVQNHHAFESSSNCNQVIIAFYLSCFCFNFVYKFIIVQILSVLNVTA